MKFLHFEKKDGTKVLSAKMPGYQLYGENYDDIDFKLSIVDGKIKIDVIVDHYMTQDDIKNINADIKHTPINWDNGYEFFDYYDIEDESILVLIADSNSNIFNLINSKNNLSNLKNMESTLKNHLK